MTLMFLLALWLPGPLAPALPAAIINVPRLLAESIDKAATAHVRALQAEKQQVLAEKQAELKRLNDVRAVKARVERAQVELQRLAEDAQLDVAALDRQVQLKFDKKLRPVLNKIIEEDHIGILFEYPQQLIVWAAPTVDITAKVIERLDAATKAGGKK